jgi:hypothetical protein
LRLPELPERALARRSNFERRSQRRRAAEAPTNLALVLVGRSASFRMAAKGQQSKLMRAIEKILVGE